MSILLTDKKIERRLAPFWRGLNDHSDTWTEHQLVALARGLPLPPADEVPPEDTTKPAGRPASNSVSGERPQDLNINSLTVPITSRSQSYNSDTSNLSPSHPAFNLSGASPPLGSPASTPFFKGRAKALAALKTSHGSGSQTDMTPQEVMLPADPHVNGQPVEAFLYKDASECPICFMYYPPYLNKTRCCDQPICSECFVQIKRPDPHPPEHHGEGPDPNNPNPPAEQPPEEDSMLVSEPAACPFCVQPEFGVTYEPPPFRRGLVYANSRGLGMQSATSAMSSSSSLNSQGIGTPGSTGRRRTTSLSASAPSVITTDRIRPDWAKKLSDARAHALRRAAAATALHNAAYVLGNVGSSDGRGLLGRRRRMFSGLSESGSNSGNGTPSRVPEPMSLGHVSAMLAAADRERARGEALQAQEGPQPARRDRRRTRMEDLEELMMMEAIRLSLASEEERRRKEEKEEAKRLKKDEKRYAKEQKKAEKAARKASGGTYPYSASGNASTTSGFAAPQTPVTPVEGKGKAVDRGPGFSPPTDPRSIDDIAGPSSSPREDAQKHLEHSRAQIQNMDASPRSVTPAINITDSNHRANLRHLSNASSSTSSLNESMPGSLGNGPGSFEASPSLSGLASPISTLDDPLKSETPPGGGAGTEPMFNFRSLAAVMGDESKDRDGASHIENVALQAPQPDMGRLSPESKSTDDANSPTGGRSRGDSGESSSSSVPPVVADSVPEQVVGKKAGLSGDDIKEAPLKHSVTQQSDPYDAKHFGDISVLDAGQAGQLR